MLELAVHCRLPVPEANGDILFAKVAGSPWGDRELKEFLVILYDDQTLEANLRKGATDGAYPYAEYDKDGKIVKGSLKRLDTTQVPAAWLVPGATIAPQPVASNALLDVVPSTAGVLKTLWMTWVQGAVT